MNEDYELPELTEDTSPSQYAFELRHSLGSMRDVSVPIHVNHATIGDYEKEHGISPPLGYLACLTRLFAEKQGLSGKELDEYRSLLVTQLRKLVLNRKWRRHFKYAMPYKDWGELNIGADAFIEKQKKLRPEGKNPSDKDKPTHTARDPLASGPFMVPTLPPQGVIGREDELSDITSLLSLDQPHVTNVPPLVLKGMGGVGKSTLAIALGRRLDMLRLFPDGVLWAELALDPVVRLILNSWGQALGIDLKAELDVQACEIRLREVLYQKRCLLIVDDVWDPNQGKHFLVAGPYCRMLFTTRETPIAVNLATRSRMLKVDVLSLRHSVELLGRFAPEAITADPAGAERLCEKLECLPLAIKLAGRLLATEADVPARMHRILEELTDHGKARLNLMQVEGDRRVDEDRPVSIQAILGLSVNRLERTDKERFAMLAPFGGEPLSWEIKAVAAVWECSLAEAERTTSELVQRGLIEPRPEGRYWMHALLWDYSKELLQQL